MVTTTEETAEAGRVASDMAEHIAEARLKARRVLDGETHLGGVDDWRQPLVAGRDAVVAVCLLWAALTGLGVTTSVGPLLVVAAVAVAVYAGIANALATQAELRYFETELERERDEVRNLSHHEREEIRFMYQAKGFSGPLPMVRLPNFTSRPWL